MNEFDDYKKMIIKQRTLSYKILHRISQYVMTDKNCWIFDIKNKEHYIFISFYLENHIMVILYYTIHSLKITIVFYIYVYTHIRVCTHTHIKKKRNIFRNDNRNS